jgi:hypothetical protein
MSKVYDDAIKAYEGMSYKRLALEFRELRTKLESNKQESRELNEQFDALTLKVIPDKMMEDDIRTMTVKDVGRLELRPNMWTSTKDNLALQDWLKEHDLAELIVPSVNGSTLKATIKELQGAGDELPPAEIVEITPYIRATVVGKG